MLDLLSKSPLQSLLKTQLPDFENNFKALLENLFMQAAEINQSNPFELALVCCLDQQEAILKVLNNKREVISQFDLSGLILDFVLQQLGFLETFVSIDEIKKHISIENINNVLLEELKDRAFVASYDSNLELTFTGLNQEGTFDINITDLVHKIDFSQLNFL